MNNLFSNLCFYHYNHGVQNENMFFSLKFRQRNILNAISKKKRFLNYMCYAWGIPFILTMITVILDNTKPFKDEWLPEIGSKTCFIKNPLGEKMIYYKFKNIQIHSWFMYIYFIFSFSDEKLSAFLYFYLWIYITATTNIVFFVLTALIIRQAQRDISRITSQSESARHQSHLNNQMDKYVTLCDAHIKLIIINHLI